MKTKAQIKATKKYEDKAYFKTLVRFHKEDEILIRSAAELAGISVNKFIVQAVLEKLSNYKK